VSVTDEVGLHLDVEQGFRAPNLDDLTSRQIAGPGFQFENPSLGPEQSTAIELGARVRASVLELDASVYAIALDGAITRAPRGLVDCPAATPSCGGAWFRYQLVNLDGTAWIVGGELAARIDTDVGLGASATVHAAWGEGPSPVPRPSDPTAPYDERAPLSRIPPVQGTIEARWAHAETRLVFGAALRWAALQERLAPSDRGDARIPRGGTPAYAIFDLRAGWRFEDHLQIQIAFENVLDEAYRVHGSGVNGPGRGFAIQLTGAI
jgi:outer membrane receptor protein involved in Fe transport